MLCTSSNQPVGRRAGIRGRTLVALAAALLFFSLFVDVGVARAEYPAGWVDPTVGEAGAAEEEGERDTLFREAAEACIQNQGGSTSLLQRRLRIGYGRAARVIDQLHYAGILGPPDGSKPRDVLIGFDQLDEYCG